MSLIDFSKPLCGFKDEDSPELLPEIQPPSMRDVDMSPPLRMDQPMQDACPSCGGWCMRLGDYVCWGICYRCYEAEEGQS